MHANITWMYDSIQLNDYLDILICLPSSKIYLLIKTRSIRVILLAILLGKKIFFPFLHLYCWLRCKGPPPLLVNLNNVVTSAAAVSPLSRHLCSDRGGDSAGGGMSLYDRPRGWIRSFECYIYNLHPCKHEQLSCWLGWAGRGGQLTAAPTQGSNWSPLTPSSLPPPPPSCVGVCWGFSSDHRISDKRAGHQCQPIRHYNLRWQIWR